MDNFNYLGELVELKKRYSLHSIDDFIKAALRYYSRAAPSRFDRAPFPDLPFSLFFSTYNDRKTSLEIILDLQRQFPNYRIEDFLQAAVKSYLNASRHGLDANLCPNAAVHSIEHLEHNSNIVDLPLEKTTERCTVVRPIHWFGQSDMEQSNDPAAQLKALQEVLHFWVQPDGQVKEFQGQENELTTKDLSWMGKVPIFKRFESPASDLIETALKRVEHTGDHLLLRYSVPKVSHWLERHAFRTIIRPTKDKLLEIIVHRAPYTPSFDPTDFFSLTR